MTGRIHNMRGQKRRYSKTRVSIGQRPDNPKYWCRLHRRSLSSKQARNKKCLEKNCPHLKPYRGKFQVLWSDEMPAPGTGNPVNENGDAESVPEQKGIFKS